MSVKGVYELRNDTGPMIPSVSVLPDYAKRFFFNFEHFDAEGIFIVKV